MKELRDEQTNTKLRIEASSAGGGGLPPPPLALPSLLTVLNHQRPLSVDGSLSTLLLGFSKPPRSFLIPYSFADSKMAEEEVDIDLADPEVSFHLNSS